MTDRNRARPLAPALAFTAAIAALFASGCGTKCATETPAIQAVASCTAAPGDVVTVPLRLCPTCNQTPSECRVDVQGSFIQLDPLVEACDGSASCPPSCLAASSGCQVTAPATPGTYQVVVYDPQRGATISGVTFTVTTGVTASCSPI